MASKVSELDAYRKFGQMRSQQHALHGDGGGGTSDDMDVIDAKIAAAEARTDTKFAELRGDLKSLASTWTVWGAAGALFLGTIAVLGFASDRFDGGVAVRSAVEDVISNQHARDANQDDKLDQILNRLPPAG